LECKTGSGSPLYLMMQKRYETEVTKLSQRQPSVGDGVMSAFVSHRPPLLKSPTSMFIGSTTLTKGPRRLWLYCHDYNRALMPTRQTHPSGKVVSAVIIYEGLCG